MTLCMISVKTASVRWIVEGQGGMFYTNQQNTQGHFFGEKGYYKTFKVLAQLHSRKIPEGFSAALWYLVKRQS